MIRLLGIVVMLVVLYVVLFSSDANAFSSDNLQPLTRNQAYFGLLTLGAGLLIITGGLDLSIGSVVALSAVLCGNLLNKGCPPFLALVLILGLGLVIGLIHGLLVTQLRLQPFLVTLCGLFVYRGLARFSSDTDVGLSTVTEMHKDDPSYAFQLDWLKYLANGNVGGESGIPTLLVVLFVLAGLLALVVHGTVYGRYFFAIGSNEEAARYAGVATDRYKILAYMICSCFASLGGVFELFQVSSVSPSTGGNFYELYAITGAVLGGCSLRGGAGTVLGVVLGAAVLPLLRNIAIFLETKDSLTYTIIGLAMLLGTTADELIKRRTDRKG